MLLEPALPDKEMLDEMDLAPLLLHLPVHLVEAPPGVGAAGRQLPHRYLHVADEPVRGRWRHRVNDQLFEAPAVFHLAETTQTIDDALHRHHRLEVPDVDVNRVHVFI